MANQYKGGWTEEEVDYLESNIGVWDFDRIAKKLGKTPKAVLKKAESLGIANTKVASGLYTMHEMAQALCLDDKTVKRLITNHGLPGKQRDFRIKNKEVDENGKKKSKRLFYYIDVTDFWKWAEANKDLINWHQVPKYALMPEPEWLEERRKTDYYKWANRRRPWTPEQDAQLWSMYYQEGMTQKEIATLLARSVNGVEKRLKRLREQKLVAV
ncbi:sigma factor-like helix-turn-helix DNA-binding protein [Bacillus thuringiensis]|uniref:Sigma-70 family RNA polymerase sigma factor n=3 Tax=Bacillus thuringiensis TaxID=1428 RepID=A0AB35PB28_BACTU|nr:MULTISPECIES: sigma factor-like helix-turn-helix DNA-binding protein [Bacillus]EAO57363.1 Hypothetical protein RBTH_07141 [Bacillus thuringiensis serovar israelensis ATCC 35646]MEC3435107.1 sigma factor-like helix-turn-helix DNA-binding protein [Bacillus cereus]AFQ30432.1 hypothetical protein BTF1_31662 [Bacillus thuringiensis HD-789]AJH02564.1 sigma-70, region 4 family protein [Bacillus thuringiensis HD1002]AND28618.1 hypothetical protein ATN07_33465 [Bacillus thuringiensis serovar israele